MNKSETVAVIRSLLSSTQSNYSVFSLNADFKTETGIDIPLFGYGNVGDFLSSIPDTVKVTGIYPLQRVSLVSNDKSAHIVSLVKRQRNSSPKKRTPFRAKATPRRFSADNRKHQTLVKKTALENSEEENDAVNGNNNSFFYTDITENTQRSFSVSSNSANTIISQKHCLGPGDSIPQINVELHAQVGQYVEVIPCKIVNPHKFYFHIRKFKRKFSDFTEKLQMFYEAHKIPKVYDGIIRPKLICAVLYKMNTEAMWRRAEIQEIVDDSHVIVNFIDHGDRVKISKGRLRYLHRDFMSLPRQAFLGSLANIRPSNGSPNWSANAINRFFDLAFGKDLVAGVVHMNPKDFCLNVALSCTKDLEIHINDTLVKEGFAEFDSGILDPHLADPFKTTRESQKKNSKGNDNDSKCPREEKRNHDEEITNDVLKQLRPSSSPKPVFYYSNNYNKNNNRLKKLFSLSE